MTQLLQKKAEKEKKHTIRDVTDRKHTARDRVKSNQINNYAKYKYPIK